MAWETGVQSLVESYQRLKKWFLISPCLTLSIIRYIVVVLITKTKQTNPIPKNDESLMSLANSI